MHEIEKKNIPFFNELSIKQLWNHFKNNATIISYFPEYGANEYPERDFFFNVLWTLYPNEVEMMIQAAYKASNLHYKKKNEELVELTNEIKEAIKSTITYKSKHFMLVKLIAINGRMLWKLKSGAVGKRQMKERIKFPADLSKFANQPSLRARRLNPALYQNRATNQRNRDARMSNVDEEEKEDIN